MPEDVEAAMSDEAVICSNPDCRVAETGKCVEGLELADCPHYGETAEVEETEEGVEAEAPLGVALPNGAALSLVDAGVLIRRADSRLIALIGPRETGKTSLIVGLYDLFQLGEVDGVGFARSSTLHAFEMACHDARDASRRGVPHTERTQRGEVLFYHLDLDGGTAGDGITLLLADRSGEEYSEVADDVSAAAELAEIRRADAITILIDGGRLLDAGKRHNIKSEVIMILQGLIDAGAISCEQRIGLVLTKLDLIKASTHEARAEEDFTGLRDQILGNFPGIITRLDIFRIAASPSINAGMRGDGVDEVLQFWLQPAPTIATAMITPPRIQRLFGQLRQLSEPLGDTQ